MPEGIEIVALEQLVLSDKTLNDVFELDYGEAADRGLVGGHGREANLIKKTTRGK